MLRDRLRRIIVFSAIGGSERGCRMDEIRVRCEACGLENRLVLQDVPVRMHLSCSHCGGPLGNVRDHIERIAVKAPPLTSPETKVG